MVAAAGYDVVDLGVMRRRDLQAAIALKCEHQSLLIRRRWTAVASHIAEMQRQISVPLMIGWHSSSKAHTAVEIDPPGSSDAVVQILTPRAR